ncbi:MAG: sigma-70 family RNA polymerase sigma factor [Thermodesulfobacteriota bacterium]
MPDNSLNDEELIKGLKQGNEASQSAFIKVFGPCLKYFIIKKFHLLEPDAEEVVAETFYKVVVNVQKYQVEKGAKFSTWVFGIAVRIATDWLRKNLKYPQMVHGAERIAVDPGDSSPEEVSKAGLLMREALSHLDPIDREILEWHAHDGKLSEIAHYLGMEQGTVRQRKLRALKKLKEIYESLLKNRTNRLN